MNEDGKNNSMISKIVEKFKGTKRKILVVEDNEMNREILETILENEYDIFFAENGRVGLDVLKKNYRDLSLILLDVFMPVMDGFIFLEKIQNDALLSSVPVIVTTGSTKTEDEIRCLKLGASDFINKPYNPEVVRGRVHSIIRLRESVTTLNDIERDELTGLYTMQSFYHHVAEVLTSDYEGNFDLSVLDLQGFKLVNSVFGEKKGDEVLAYIGKWYIEHDRKSIMARYGDKFFSLYPSEGRMGCEDRQKKLDELVSGAPVSNLKIKVGIYENVDRDAAPSVLCDRVILTALSIANNFTKTIAVYNEEIKAKFETDQTMEMTFEKALENKEFNVWYQPKISTITGEIEGAEALVRWIRDDGTVVAPADFIPLFEADGLISQIDEYVFEQVCALLKQRIDEGKPVIPVSINLSRNSIYQSTTVKKYSDTILNLGIPLDLVPLELTETAATENKDILDLVTKFKEVGFSIHMDDFGTGYSSLSCLTTLPFDAIKLDKSLVDTIGTKKGNTIIRHMIEIAHEMGMKVVAEGVEQEPQVDFLKMNSCDTIQGFYYSEPKRALFFEKMMDRLGEAG